MLFLTKILGTDNISKLKKIISKKDLIGLIILFVFIYINILLEVISIGLILPIVDLAMNDKQNSYLFTFIENKFKFGLEKEKYILLFLSTFFIIFIIKCLFNLYINYKQMNIKFSILSALSMKFYSFYLKKNFEFFVHNKKVGLIKNIIEESRNLIEGLIFQIVNIISDVLIVISIIVFLLLTFSLETSLLILYFLVLLLIYTLFIKKKLYQMGQLRYSELEKRYQSISDGLNSIVQIKLNSNENYFLSRYQNHNKKYFDLSLKYSIIQIIPKYFFEIFLSLFFLAIIYLNYFQGKQIHLIISLISVFAIAGYRIIPAFARMIVSFQSIYHSKPVLDNFPDVDSIKDQTMIFFNKRNQIVKSNFNKKITVSNLHFSYDTKIIIKNLSFEVEKGSLIGFKGKSGVGKSTLFFILMGLIKKKDGKIIFDDNDIDIENLNFGKNIGYLNQDTFLIDDTIKNNIVHGNSDSKIDNNFLKLNEALKMAEIYDFVDKLPNKLDSYLGDDGSIISAGQKQRIGLARLFFNRKQFIFLDEATNSLDKHTEKKIFQNIRQLDGTVTKFVISHDSSNLDICDRVIEL